MNTNGTLIGTRWGPASAIRPQPRGRHATEIWVGTPARPWGSRRLPRTLCASDPRRTLFRTLLRRAEGVEVELADGTTGVVDEVALSPLGFDFWAEALVVATPDGHRRVPTRAVRRIDVREPRIWLRPVSADAFEGVDRLRDERDRHEHRRHRLQRRQDLVQVRMLSRRRRQQAETRVGGA